MLSRWSVFLGIASSSLICSSPSFAAPITKEQMVAMLRTIDVRQHNSGDWKSVAYMEAKERDKTDTVYEMLVFRRDKDEIRASYISYNTETEAYRAEGQRGSDAKAPDSETRVRGVFQPRAKETKGESARLQPAPVPKGKD